MEYLNKELLNFGAFFVFVMFVARELFAWLKVRDSKKSNGVVKELQSIGGNHLEHILEAIKEQTFQHDKMLEVLTTIKTILEERK